MRRRFSLLAAALIVIPFPALAGDDVKVKPPPSATELAAKIDGFIEAALAAKDIEPAPLASDAEFHRRVYLDLAGRIPTEAEVRTFLGNTAPDRRTQLVNALLASAPYVEHMSNTWQTVIGPSSVNLQPAFRNWLTAQVRENTPYDKMIRDLLTLPTYNPAPATTGKIDKQTIDLLLKNPKTFNPTITFDPNPTKVKFTPKVGGKVDFNNAVELNFVLQQQLAVNQVSAAAFFFEANGYKPENLAASTARRFLGVRLECAQCHNHPFARWTRKQFWEFAAFFTAVQPPIQTVYLTTIENSSIELTPVIQPPSQKAEPAITIPGTNKVVQARFPDGQSPLWKDKGSVEVLAEWLTSPSNPYFARTAANRLWAHFFGAGIIDPVDGEPSEDNPASHPQLLAELTAQFVASKYDVKYLIRAITASRTYQRTSAASHISQHQPRVFARMAVKGLTAEQLFDSLALATGFQDASGNPPGMIVPNTPRGDFLALFSTADKTTETQTSILQALTLMNGKLVADATSVTTSLKLATLLKGPATNASKLESLYLMTLSRLPRAQEVERLLAYVDSQGDAPSALADVFWALLNSAEFRFNH
jgi:Protein of unknown function (DUF1549)/Protein of unknown function (DUF1553)